jgi:hypothetical protein
VLDTQDIINFVAGPGGIAVANQNGSTGISDGNTTAGQGGLLAGILTGTIQLTQGAIAAIADPNQTPGIPPALRAAIVAAANGQPPGLGNLLNSIGQVLNLIGQFLNNFSGGNARNGGGQGSGGDPGSGGGQGTGGDPGSGSDQGGGTDPGGDSSVPGGAGDASAAPAPGLPSVSASANAGTSADSDVDDSEAGDQPVKQTRRYLQLKNDTGSKLTVYLQYRTQTDKGDWQWFPADPRQSTEALRFELAAGQETYLEDNGWTINASRVHIWAVADGGDQWSEYKDKDLWLVPEFDQAGNHYYLAPAMETYPHTFGR